MNLIFFKISGIILIVVLTNFCTYTPKATFDKQFSKVTQNKIVEKYKGYSLIDGRNNSFIFDTPRKDYLTLIITSEGLKMLDYINPMDSISKIDGKRCDSLLNIANELYKELRLLNIQYFISNSTRCILYTSICDSTYNQIRDVNPKYIDPTYDKFHNSSTKNYYYGLLYFYNHGNDNEVIRRMKQDYAIFKINVNWYYFRTFEYSTE